LLSFDKKNAEEDYDASADKKTDNGNLLERELKRR